MINYSNGGNIGSYRLLQLELVNHEVLSSLMNFRGGAIQFFGTKRHHDKWLRDTENYGIKGCFAMSELGHGSNVCEGCLIIWFYDARPV